jgi:hypothetical protein
MLRDVREVVASMFTVGLLEQLNDTVAAKIEQRGDFRERFRAELATIEESPHPDLALGALYWKEKTLAIFEYDRIGLPMLGVRYEDLTSDPQGQLRRIVRFLDVPWEEGLLDHPSHPHGELDSSGLAIAMTDPKRAIDRASVRSWERTFGPEQLAAIMAVAGDTNQRIHTDHVVDSRLRRILDAYASASGVA